MTHNATVDSPENGYEIPHRPRRISHKPVTDDDGNPVTDENGDEIGGGYTIEGYCLFEISSEDYSSEEVVAELHDAAQWGPYLLSWWEEKHPVFWDSEERCRFEVRVLPERVAIDVKLGTTEDAVKLFVERLTGRLGGSWNVERTSENISA